MSRYIGDVSAYALAVSQGYTGTEEEYAELMASYATVAQTAVNAKDAAVAANTAAQSAKTAAAGSASTAQTAATTATSKANEATTAAGTATTKAAEASQSASTASTAASTASTKASEATTAASNATTAKNDAVTAKTAAETAQGKAEDAQAAAESVAESIPSDYSQLSEDVTELKENFTQLDETAAKIDGSYDTMTVGNAKQLVSTVGVEDSVPYNFRTAGGSADIGDRLVDKLVGGTIAWNQMVNADNAVSGYTKYGIEMLRVSGKFAFTASGTYSYSSGDRNFYVFNLYENRDYLIAGHKYLVTNTSKWFCAYAYGAGATAATISGNVTGKSNQGGVIINCTGSGSYRLSLHAGTNIPNDTVINETIYVNVFDLTQMFGSTIADYIYSLKTANAGAGVAWFRHLFPKPYYEYNAGELMSVQAASHITRGFNAWDEEWENGDINANTGNNGTSTTNWRSKNYIPIIPSTTYYAYSPTAVNKTLRARFYDANKNYLGYTPKSGLTYTDSTFVTPDNAYFMRFSPNISDVPNHDICINLSWDGERDGEYEEYTEHVYPLDDSLTLRGIPKLDANNNLYYDGDEYEADGTVTRRYKQDQMTYEWLSARDENSIGYYSNRGAVWVRNWNYADMKMRPGGINALCNAFDISVMDSSIMSTQYRIYFFGQTDVSSFLTKVQALETAGSGLYLVYELAEPTTETADPFQNPQIVDDFGTEEYVDAGVTATTPTRDVAIPVGHETTYQANLRAKLEMTPDSPSDGDGDYIVRQTNGTNEYVKMIKELPSAPTTDGSYHLEVTVASGTPTLTWVADE